MMKERTCVLCGRRLRGWGNNPWPLAKEGECCDECNLSVMIARIAQTNTRIPGARE